ncbi:MAG: stress responsive protein [Verrucomicrobia bacterium]|nr:MAG: stress responsive protein [Verrucomicrobiota bacterium]
MPKTMHYRGDSRPFAHMFFFQLCDTSPELLRRFIELCRKYLGGHPGQDHFSVGIRALEINRPVSGTNFVVSVHMIFRNKAAFDEYSESPTHEDFITKSAGMSPIRIVYDSYLELAVLPDANEPKRKTRRA